MPPPSYVKKPLIGQFALIGDAVIGELLDVPADAFAMQLEAARDFGVSFLAEDANQHMIGVSAVTSLLKSGDIMHKNMIVPRDFLRHDPRLHAHCVVGVFVRGQVRNGLLPTVDEVEVAGWASTQDIRQRRSTDRPVTFESKLPTVFVPCTELNPIDTLVDRLHPDEFDV
jgi:hypothetical protein